MVVLTADRFWRTLHTLAPRHADAYLQSCRSVPQAPVTKTFICCTEHLGVVRDNLDGKAKRIEGLAEGQIHIAEKFILRFARRGPKSTSVYFLTAEVAAHRIVFQLLSRNRLLFSNDQDRPFLNPQIIYKLTVAE